MGVQCSDLVGYGGLVATALATGYAAAWMTNGRNLREMVWRGMLVLAGSTAGILVSGVLAAVADASCIERRVHVSDWCSLRRSLLERVGELGPTY
jgi:hypothetical protein